MLQQLPDCEEGDEGLHPYRRWRQLRVLPAQLPMQRNTEMTRVRVQVQVMLLTVLQHERRWERGPKQELARALHRYRPHQCSRLPRRRKLLVRVCWSYWLLLLLLLRLQLCLQQQRLLEQRLILEH